MRRLLIAWLIALGMGGAAYGTAGEEVVVGCSANAAPVVGELAEDFTSRTGIHVSMSIGATGLLARQVREGAPFDLFVSADMATVERLASEGFVTSASVECFARGRLALFQAPGEALRVTTFTDLARPEFATMRLAVANPETAPYGAAAMQALGGLGVREIDGRRIIQAPDVGAALQYCESGNVDAAFVALALVKNRPGRFVVVPEEWHAPIHQGLGVLTSAAHREAAELLRRALVSPEALPVYGKYGYEPCTDDDASN